MVTKEHKMNVGDKVQTGVYVCGEWAPMHTGIIVSRVNSQLVNVDIGSLHGCAPWIRLEEESKLQVI
jgi:hypothetical protein